jgi:probable HAF family extracellular repeat protein
VNLQIGWGTLPLRRLLADWGIRVADGMHRRCGRMSITLLTLFLASLVVGAGGATAKTRSVTVTDLGTLGGTFSFALAVNASGQVVGYSDTAGNAATHAFSWTQAGGMVDLGTLGGTSSTASAVNANGEVVGSSTTAGNAALHAVLWQQSGGARKYRHTRASGVVEELVGAVSATIARAWRAR